jgi:hypothetical protein
MTFQILRKVCLQNLSVINDLLINVDQEYSQFVFNGADASKCTLKRQYGSAHSITVGQTLREEIAWKKYSNMKLSIKKNSCVVKNILDFQRINNVH